MLTERPFGKRKKKTKKKIIQSRITRYTGRVEKRRDVSRKRATNARFQRTQIDESWTGSPAVYTIYLDISHERHTNSLRHWGKKNCSINPGQVDGDLAVIATLGKLFSFFFFFFNLHNIERLRSESDMKVYEHIFSSISRQYIFARATSV